MYGQTYLSADTRQAMETLKSLGIATVKVSFSGGNDEGGADGIDFFDADGNKVETNGALTSSAYQDQIWNEDTKSWGPTQWIVWEGTGSYKDRTKRPATPDEVRAAEVNAILEAPIYDEYGSFAGEFSVYGTLTWDVATGRSEMHGQYESRSWDEF
jgi:hypothetical protein